MSEKLSEHESSKSGERLEVTSTENSAEREKALEAEEAEALKVEKLDNDSEKVPADTAASIKKKLADPEDKPKVYPPDKALKSVALRNYLGTIRGHLNTREKIFSKVIHQPTINSISEMTGKTLIRPSGILTGGILTTLGSLLYYIEVKRTGYRYNFMLALLLLVGGFVVGIILESIFKLVTRRVKS